MSSKDHLFVEPIVVTEFWINRSGHSLQIKFLALDGTFIDVRKRAMREGKLVPTQDGICIALRKLPVLAAGINKALKKATELGLVKSPRP
jgi:hypothetical protein